MFHAFGHGQLVVTAEYGIIPSWKPMCETYAFAVRL